MHTQKDALHAYPEDRHSLVLTRSSALGAQVNMGETEGDDLAGSFSKYLQVLLKREWVTLGVSPAFLLPGCVRKFLTPLFSGVVLMIAKRTPTLNHRAPDVRGENHQRLAPPGRS
jgi:hypothetical protein